MWPVEACFLLFPEMIVPRQWCMVCALECVVVGDLASGIPHSAAAGALATTGEKAHRVPCGALCFFVRRPSLTQASLQRSVRVQKKLSSVAWELFSVVAVRGGFEPPVRLPVRQFSKLVVSATHPSHLSAQWVFVCTNILGLQI